MSLLLKDLLQVQKGFFNLGRAGVSRAIKSDYARKKIKQVGQKYLDEVHTYIHTLFVKAGR